MFASQIKNAIELTFLLCYSSYCRFLFRPRHSTLGKSRWWRIRTWSSLLSTIHQKPIYKWNNSHRTEYILNTGQKKKVMQQFHFAIFTEQSLASELDYKLSDLGQVTCPHFRASVSIVCIQQDSAIVTTADTLEEENSYLQESVESPSSNQNLKVGSIPRKCSQ